MVDNSVKFPKAYSIFFFNNKNETPFTQTHLLS